ncbi:MAG: hypothetical protein R3267_05320 [Paenisporosarcina sp.]|nr:hypothetical protein [Paenisporosarcina sp.]
MRNNLIILIFFIVLALMGCSERDSNNSNSDWAYSFIVWDGYIYELSDEYVEDVKVEIGEVTYFSNEEGTYEGNYSNKYNKGTKYFSIVGINTDEAIAIKEGEGKYRKVIRNGKYSLDSEQDLLGIRKEITEGDFIYRLVSEKEEYVENGPVKLYAELEYIGEKEKIEISHAASPFYFLVVEKNRNYQIDYGMNEPLLHTTLIKGVPLREEYSPSGGYSSQDDKEYIDFMKHIMNNEFPLGHYVVNGGTHFFVAGVDTEEEKKFRIDSEIAFKVTSEK